MFASSSTNVAQPTGPQQRYQLPRGLNTRQQRACNAIKEEQVRHMPLRIRNVIGYEGSAIPLLKPSSVGGYFDFLDLPAVVRKEVYTYLLITVSEEIFFRRAREKYGLHPAILHTSHAIYNEGRPILYGRNTFTAEDPANLFYPNGLPALRKSTTTLIRHVSFGTVTSIFYAPHETAEDITAPILRTLNTYPGLSHLHTLSIHREIIRPAGINWKSLEFIAAYHGKKAESIRKRFSKRGLVLEAVQIFMKDAIKRGLPFAEAEVQRENEYIFGRRSRKKKQYICNIIQIRLLRSKEKKMVPQGWITKARQAMEELGPKPELETTEDGGSDGESLSAPSTTTHISGSMSPLQSASTPVTERSDSEESKW